MAKYIKFSHSLIHPPYGSKFYIIHDTINPKKPYKIILEDKNVIEKIIYGKEDFASLEEAEKRLDEIMNM